MRLVQQGETCELFVNPNVGWVDAVCSYAHQGQYILDTREHGRFSLSQGGHPDVRIKGEKLRNSGR